MVQIRYIVCIIQFDVCLDNYNRFLIVIYFNCFILSKECMCLRCLGLFCSFYYYPTCYWLSSTFHVSSLGLPYWKWTWSAAENVAEKCSSIQKQRLFKWNLLLQDFIFEIKQKKGSGNDNADGLSRGCDDEMYIYTKSS